MYTNNIKNIDVTLNELKGRFNRFESICADIKYINILMKLLVNMF